MCEGCVWHRYERDTGFSYCVNEDAEALIENCKLYYNKDDAKDDAKFGSLDYY